MMPISVPFREDLYHRLNVIPLHVPPLRERRDDIPLLAWAFVEAIGRRMGKTIKNIPRRTMEQLQRYAWPGNVRELSNVIERAVLLSTDGRISSTDLLLTPSAPVDFAEKPADQPIFARNDELERSHLVRALEETHWDLPAAATMLDVSVDTLQQRMDRHGLYAPAK